MNIPYALILTDSTHAPTVIGHYNSRQTIDEIRSAIRSYFTDDEPVLPTDIIPGTAIASGSLNCASTPSRFIFPTQNALLILLPCPPSLRNESCRKRLRAPKMLPPSSSRPTTRNIKAFLPTAEKFLPPTLILSPGFNTESQDERKYQNDCLKRERTSLRNLLAV